MMKIQDKLLLTSPRRGTHVYMDMVATRDVHKGRWTNNTVAKGTLAISRVHSVSAPLESDGQGIDKPRCIGNINQNRAYRIELDVTNFPAWKR